MPLSLPELHCILCLQFTPSLHFDARLEDFWTTCLPVLQHLSCTSDHELLRLLMGSLSCCWSCADRYCLSFVAGGVTCRGGDCSPDLSNATNHSSILTLVS